MRDQTRVRCTACDNYQDAAAASPHGTWPIGKCAHCGSPSLMWARRASDRAAADRAAAELMEWAKLDACVRELVRRGVAWSQLSDRVLQSFGAAMAGRG
jgi:hypothetical protein